MNQLTLVPVTLEKELSLHYDGFIAFLQICLPTFSLEVHASFGGYVSNESDPGDTDTDDGQEQQSVKQKQTCGCRVVLEIHAKAFKNMKFNWLG